MADKSKRSKRQRMIDLPLEEQDARAECFEIRALVREANEHLVEMLRQWVNDTTPDYERFHAEGHNGQYHELPIGTLARKLFDLGWTQQAIREALQKRETVYYRVSICNLRNTCECLLQDRMPTLGRGERQQQIT